MFSFYGFICGLIYSFKAKYILDCRVLYGGFEVRWTQHAKFHRDDDAIDNDDSLKRLISSIYIVIFYCTVVCRRQSPGQVQCSVTTCRPALQPCPPSPGRRRRTGGSRSPLSGQRSDGVADYRGPPVSTRPRRQWGRQWERRAAAGCWRKSRSSRPSRSTRRQHTASRPSNCTPRSASTSGYVRRWLWRPLAPIEVCRPVKEGTRVCSNNCYGLPLMSTFLPWIYVRYRHVPGTSVDACWKRHRVFYVADIRILVYVLYIIPLHFALKCIMFIRLSLDTVF